MLVLNSICSTSPPDLVPKLLLCILVVWSSLFTRELRKSSWETILFQFFLVHNLFVTIASIIFERMIGYKIHALHFLVSSMDLDMKYYCQSLMLFPLHETGYFAYMPKRFFLFKKVPILELCLVINLHVWP